MPLCLIAFNLYTSNLFEIGPYTALSVLSSLSWRGSRYYLFSSLFNEILLFHSSFSTKLGTILNCSSNFCWFKICCRLGKTVITSQDYSGFIVNRILMPMINEAFYTLYTNVATKEDIDTGMKLGTNHPMGPLELADFIGLDVCLSIMKVLHAGLGDNKYAPCPLLVQYVDAGRLGRKRGIGVYDYSKEPRSTKSSSRL
jgi:hypothetical protein